METGLRLNNIKDIWEEKLKESMGANYWMVRVCVCVCVCARACTILVLLYVQASVSMLRLPLDCIMHSVHALTPCSHEGFGPLCGIRYLCVYVFVLVAYLPSIHWWNKGTSGLYQKRCVCVCVLTRRFVVCTWVSYG